MITIIIQPHVHYIHAHISYIIAICHIPYCVLYILYMHTIYIHTIYIQEIIAGPRPTNYNNNIHQTKCNKLLQILCNNNNKTNKNKKQKTKQENKKKKHKTQKKI